MNREKYLHVNMAKQTMFTARLISNDIDDHVTVEPNVWSDQHLALYLNSIAILFFFRCPVDLLSICSVFH